MRAPLLLPAILALALIAALHPRFGSAIGAGRTARYAGTVTGDVRVTGNERMFPFALDRGPVVRARVAAPVHAGERLLVRGRLDPLDEPRNPGEPSARELGFDEGISGELAITAILARSPPDLHDARIWMPIVRERASLTVRRIIPEPEASVLAGALWGERAALPDAVRADFQATGTVHVLVTAGLHLGIVAALIAGACAFAGLPRAPAALGTIPLVYAYAWFSGGHVPAQRAAAMIAVALVARACGARAMSLNTLAIAAIIVAVSRPASVASASFALSFSCVTAIVLFAEPFASALRRRLPERVADVLAVTSAAQVGVWPLTATLFFVLAPFAIAANAIVVPMMGLILPAGALALALAPIPVAGAFVARIETTLLALVVAVVHGIAALPFARLTIAPPPGWALAAYASLVVVARLALVRSARVSASIIAAASLLVVVAATVRAPHGLEITVLDVGQGDAIVIRTPRDRIVMIDTGGMLERGPTIDGRSPAEAAAQRTVLPYLQRAGIRRVDVLILTHPHGDHVGGAAAIINTMPVGIIFDSGQAYAGRAYRDAMAAAGSHHVPVVLARRGMQWSSGDGVTIEVLAPSMPFLADTGDDVNENSIVVMLRSDGFRALFMGDAGEASEARLLAAGIDLHADAVKVGHHGSRYASTSGFVAAVRPQIAVISVGRHNTFGHPAKATIDAWHHAGANILRTDQCGAISLVDRAPTTMLACASP